MGEDREALKRGVPLLDYLQQHSWIGWPAGRGEYVGLCPLHEETRPSFYVNTRKDVLNCHGCGEGSDLLRFLQRTEGPPVDSEDHRLRLSQLCQKEGRYNAPSPITDTRFASGQSWFN